MHARSGLSLVALHRIARDQDILAATKALPWSGSSDTLA